MIDSNAAAVVGRAKRARGRRRRSTVDGRRRGSTERVWRIIDIDTRDTRAIDRSTGRSMMMACDEDGDAYVSRVISEYYHDDVDDDDDDNGMVLAMTPGMTPAAMTTTTTTTTSKRGDARDGVFDVADDGGGGKRAKTVAGASATTSAMTSVSSGDVDMAVSPLRVRLPWCAPDGFPADPSAY
jgi:hypothetical protein